MSIYFLILIGLNFNRINGNDEKIFYPKYWHDAPSSINDYPLINNSRIIDPWFYPHRLGLYKILIEITTPLMPFCSSSNASNILFALPSQFSWQFESNRLFTNGTLNISSKSWWASANYYLSVIPFLAAVQVGLIPSTNFQIIQIEDFCTTIIDCFVRLPRAMIEWHRFFTKIQIKTNTSINDQIIDRDYLEPLWAANIATIEESLPLVEKKLIYLPSSVERFFGYAWARLLHLIGMTRKNTNLYETLKNQRTFLPRRMLTEGDLLLRNSNNDFSPSVQRSLSILFSFHFEWLNFIEQIWKRITCNYSGRLNAQRVLETMGKSKIIAAQYFLRAVFSTILSPCEQNFRNDL